MSIINQTMIPIIFDSSSSGQLTQNDLDVMISILIGLNLYVIIVIFFMYQLFRIKNKYQPVKVKFTEFWEAMSFKSLDNLSKFLVVTICEALALMVLFIDVLLLFSWFGMIIYSLFK